MALLAGASISHAQSTRAWTGLAAPDNNWNTVSNWNTGVPINGDTALFNGSGNGNTSLSLAASTQPINTIRFDGTIATSYVLGVLASGDKFNFDAGGAITIANNVAAVQTINADVQINSALTVTNSGSSTLALAGNVIFAGSGTFTVNNAVANTTTSLGGNITDIAGQPGSLSLLATTIGAANNNNFIINGTNTYTGTTTILVNTGSAGSIQIGSDSPFGTGAANINLVSGTSAPQFSALGGTRTIANALNLNSGMTFVGSNSLVFTGPIIVINSAIGGTRSLNNSITAAGKNVTFGASPGSSTITLGNPVSNGGDGVGKTAIFAPSAGATVIINDVMQDPVSGGGSASGSVQYAGGGVTQINGLNTYTGDTLLASTANIIRVGSNSNALPGPSFTAGPFGTGTIIFNSSLPGSLQPFGADRTVANAINMTFGFVTSNPTAAEDPSGPHNLSLTGPITLGATGRIITNNLTSGTVLTLGLAATPSTITLGSTLTVRTQVAGGGMTIVNDAITGVGGLTVQDSATVHLNGANNYSGATSVSGTGTPKLFVNGTKTGTGTVTIGSVGTLGGTGSIAGTITNNGKIAPGLSVGTLTATGDVVMGTNSHLAIELSGSSADTLVVGGNLNLSNVDFLDVTGAGSGLSWVIATYTGTLTGTFNNVTSGYTVNYGSGSNSQITLNGLATGLNGDFDNNGKVDAGDYATWRKSEGTNNALPNDGGLGTPIGPSHYTLWRSNFGKPPGSGSGALNIADAVPEPATALLIFLGTAGWSAVNGRRRIKRS